MKEGIVALHARKTDESRRKAQIEIEKWQNVRELLSQAEEQAECKIILPAELSDLVLLPISERVVAAHTFDHVSAVGVAKKIIAERARVIDAANGALQQDIENRKSKEEALAKEVQKAVRKENQAVSEISDQALAEIGHLPTAGATAGWLLFSLAALFIGGIAVIGEALAILDPASFGPSPREAQSAAAAVVFLTVIFGWALVSIFLTVLLGKWLLGRRDKIEQRKEREISSLEENLRQELIPLEEKLKVAKLQCQKAEAALGFLVDSSQGLTR